MVNKFLVSAIIVAAISVIALLALLSSIDIPVPKEQAPPTKTFVIGQALAYEFSRTYTLSAINGTHFLITLTQTGIVASNLGDYQVPLIANTTFACESYRFTLISWTNSSITVR